MVLGSRSSEDIVFSLVRRGDLFDNDRSLWDIIQIDLIK